MNTVDLAAAPFAEDKEAIRCGRTSIDEHYRIHCYLTEALLLMNTMRRAGKASSAVSRRR